jgi:hypothetical protein
MSFAGAEDNTLAEMVCKWRQALALLKAPRAPWMEIQVGWEPEIPKKQYLTKT